jgi:hypothetical protein
VRAELGGVPVRTGVFVVAEDGDTVLCPELGEDLGGVSLAVENEGEAGQEGLPSNSFAVGWPGTSNSRRGTRSSMMVSCRPGSMGLVTQKKDMCRPRGVDPVMASWIRARAEPITLRNGRKRVRFIAFHQARRNALKLRGRARMFEPVTGAGVLHRRSDLGGHQPKLGVPLPGRQGQAAGRLQSGPGVLHGQSLFAGIYRLCAGLGSDTASLSSGPAINALTIILPARVPAWELPHARWWSLPKWWQRRLFPVLLVIFLTFPSEPTQNGQHGIRWRKRRQTDRA